MTEFKKGDIGCFVQESEFFIVIKVLPGQRYLVYDQYYDNLIEHSGNNLTLISSMFREEE